MSFALVCSGGGALGAAHLGVLRAIDSDYSFDTFAGSSAGAIVVASYVCGKSPSEILKILQSQSFFSLAFDFTKNSFGILRGKKVLNLLEEIFDGKSFEDLPSDKKLFIGATDFSTGEKVVLTSGSIAYAVRASLSVPFLFEPVFHQGKWLVDGGLSQNFPIDIILKHFPEKKIIGIDVGTAIRKNLNFSETSLFRKASCLRDVVEQTFRIFSKSQQPDHFPSNVYCIRPELSSFTFANTSAISDIEECGYTAGINFLKKSIDDKS